LGDLINLDIKFNGFSILQFFLYIIYIYVLI